MAHSFKSQEVIEIIISGGAVQDVQCPPNIKVIIKDYDVDREDCDGEWDIRKDKDGVPYQHMEW
jgi:hypothetical protein